jgi:hypothetical protein
MQVTRGIEMMLLVKTDGRWKIVPQAWDTEGESKPIPANLRFALTAACDPLVG